MDFEYLAVTQTVPGSWYRDDSPATALNGVIREFRSNVLPSYSFDKPVNIKVFMIPKDAAINIPVDTDIDNVRLMDTIKINNKGEVV